ncbi:MAG: polysaccharide deacetylase family protein [Planctomycetes bacterium]|nr:polysaccharide deacetylase family protein [Planctomycetota bacterium]
MVQALKNAVKAVYSGALWHSGLLSAWLRVRPGRRWPWILCYHHIEPAAFESHLRCLVRRYRVVTLDASLAALPSVGGASVPRVFSSFSRGTEPPPTGTEPPPAPPNAVAITFDDGYQQVYTELYPLLVKYEAPATVFVPTTPVDTGQPLWFNRVKAFINSTPTRSVRLGGREFQLGPGREAAYVEAMKHLNAVGIAERDALVAELLAGAEPPAELMARYRPLAWDQLRAMKGLVTVGGHTRTHPWLSRLARAEAEDEILGSKARIEEMLGTPVRHFAYPFGSPESFTEETIEILKAGGFLSAATTGRSPCRPGMSPYALPRILFDGSAGGKVVAARLSGLWLFITT